MNKILEVKNLNKSFGKEKILYDINMDIYPNEIVGFIGPNGAGKSTAMKCILSLIFPNSGTITVNGFDIKKERSKALGSMAGVIESPGLFLDMSGENNIKLFAELRGVDSNRVKEIMKFTELGYSLKRKVGNYSMGMKQRLALGIALLSKPRLLILDEPTNGLDPTAVINLRKELLDLVNNEDISILFASHQLEEVEKLSDRLICINKGRIIQPEIISTLIDIYIIEVDNIDKAISILRNKHVSHVVLKDKKIEVSIEKGKIQDFIISIANDGISISNLEKKVTNLEELYKGIYFDEKVY